MRQLGLAMVLTLVAGCGDPGDEPPTGSADTGTIDTGSIADARVDSETTDAAADSGSDAATDSVADSKSDATADSDASLDSASDVATDSIPDSIADSIADSTSETDVGADASDAADAPDAPTPYRHTLTIDGSNDFTASAEKFGTTTTGYDAYVTWDASALFVGYAGTDMGTGASPTKWVLVYLDVDPGASTGATSAEKYATQQPKLPTGFGADYYFGWKTNDSFSQFKKFSGGTWSTVTGSGVTVAKSTGFVEMRIPLSALGTTPPTKVGLVTFMLNEVSGGEYTYAGIWTGSFTDGYDPAKSIGYWLSADFASAAFPNVLANRKP